MVVAGMNRMQLRSLSEPRMERCHGQHRSLDLARSPCMNVETSIAAASRGFRATVKLRNFITSTMCWLSPQGCRIQLWHWPKDGPDPPQAASSAARDCTLALSPDLGSIWRGAAAQAASCSVHDSLQSASAALWQLHVRAASIAGRCTRAASGPKCSLTRL